MNLRTLGDKSCKPCLEGTHRLCEEGECDCVRCGLIGRSKLTTQEKSEAILKKIVELANAGKTVSFDEDWGGNSLTIHVGDGHTHVGGVGSLDDAGNHVDSEFDQLVDELYNSLHGGPGLSWA